MFPPAMSCPRWQPNLGPNAGKSCELGGSVNWDVIRAEFPALGQWTYLNTATYGQVPLRSQDAVARHFAHRDKLACQDFLGWFDDADEIRLLLAQLIHCNREDIAFASTAGAALSLFLG